MTISRHRGDLEFKPAVSRIPSAALSGFERISRTWNEQHNSFVARVLPGEVYVSAFDEIVTTVLGSCISACIFDPSTGIGGMNHFMLPSTSNGLSEDGQLATRYGLHAMEELINGIMKNGGRRSNLQVKLFGGGKMIPSMGDVGKKNIEFAQKYLSEEGFVVLSEDLGSIHPRRVNFYPRTGKVMLKRLRPLHKQALADRDMALMRTLKTESSGNDVELF